MATPRLNLRERDVLEVVQRLGQASADDVRAEMPDPPSNSAVRTHLRILEDKGTCAARRRAQVSLPPYCRGREGRA